MTSITRKSRIFRGCARRSSSSRVFARADVAELVYAPGLGPGGPLGPWRFESSRPHLDSGARPRGSDLVAMSAVSKTVNPGSNPGSPADSHDRAPRRPSITCSRMARVGTRPAQRMPRALLALAAATACVWLALSLGPGIAPAAAACPHARAHPHDVGAFQDPQGDHLPGQQEARQAGPPPARAQREAEDRRRADTPGGCSPRTASDTDARTSRASIDGSGGRATRRGRGVGATPRSSVSRTPRAR